MTETIVWTEVTQKLSALKPYERNPRRISKDAYEKLKAGLQEFGYHQRLICQPDGGVIGGHQRLRAMKELGWKQVDVLVPNRPLTEDEYRKLVVTDNLPYGEFDMELLSADYEIEELLDWGMPPNWLGEAVEADEIDSVGEEQDEVPEPPVAPKTVLGDVWVLGNHRIVCGDSTDPLVVDKALNGIKPNLMVTDPPYGVEYDADWRNQVERANGKKIGGRAVGKVENDDNADWREAWALFPGNIAYIWHAGKFAGTVQNSLEACGFDIRSQIIWAKSNFAISRGDYHWQHEPCWYAVRKGGTGNWMGDRKQTTLWQIDKPQKSETGHSTQKPVECMRRPIENNSSPGQAVYEPFSGSGTTIIACEQTGRTCHAIELNPAYVDVAVQRWQNLTGLKATHGETGEAF